MSRQRLTDVALCAVLRQIARTLLDNAIAIFERAGWGDQEKIRELREERGRR